MIRRLIGILGFITVMCSPSFAQPYIIQGTIEHSGQGMVYLASYYGDRFTIADSIETTSGSFLFLLPEAQHPGVYRLIFSDEYQGIRSENRFVEFIYNREDVLLNISIDENGPIPGFDNSTENRVYFEFMTFQFAYDEMLVEVYSQLARVVHGDENYQRTVTAYEELQDQRNGFMDSLTLLYRIGQTIIKIPYFFPQFIPAHHIGIILGEDRAFLRLPTSASLPFRDQSFCGRKRSYGRVYKWAD